MIWADWPISERLGLNCSRLHGYPLNVTMAVSGKTHCIVEITTTCEFGARQVGPAGRLCNVTIAPSAPV